ncbi:MAG: helix-turn-helix transcriptional regulator [Myxococcaceae bacterium]
MTPARGRTHSKSTRSERSPTTPPAWAPRLAEAVRSRRKALKMTQAQLAALAECGLVFLYDLEQGKPTLRLDKVVSVLTVLGLELTLQPGHSGVRTAAPAAAPDR